MQAEVLEVLEKLAGFLQADCAVLAENASRTQTWVDAVVKEFYDTVFAQNATAKVFHDGERAAREKTLHDWYLEVTSGKIDQQFWEHQWFVGLVHIKRHVDNQFVVGIMSRLQNLFLNQCLAEFEQAKAQQVFAAFKHVTDVVVGLIVEGYKSQYLDAIERTSGISPALIEHMATTEADRMVEEHRASIV
jgi:hypothetical protein